MTQQKKGPTLTDAKGMGGVNAQDGFDYQVWDALARLPGWLRNPAFEGFIVEGLEDVEARFFTPYAPLGRVVDRYQSKSGVLAASGIRDVVQSFYDFDDAHPKLARVQTLVTPQLPPTLNWIARDANRIKLARPFYAPFPEVLAASDEKFKGDLEKEFGRNLGPFFQKSVEVGINNVSSRQNARASFLGALQVEFPHLDVSSRKVEIVFDSLFDLATRTRGTLIQRSELVKSISDLLEMPLIPDGRLRLHLRSDRSGTTPATLEIDASRFSGTGGLFPAASEWQTELVQPLKLTANWAHAQGRRRIYLDGSYRISTAFTVGWAFRSASGFEMDIETKVGQWSTDIRPETVSGQVPWRIDSPTSIPGNRLCVVVGVIREPIKETRQAFGGLLENEMLIISLPKPIRDSQEAQVFAQAVKSVVAAHAGRLGAKAVDLFVAAPAAFVVALGHRWNALPPTQLHEFLVAKGQYQSTVLIQ